MNWLTLGLGIFALGCGLFTIYARLKFPSKFGKLEAMKQAYGQRRGSLVHIVSYTIIPIVFDLMGIVGGIRGVSLFGE